MITYIVDVRVAASRVDEWVNYMTNGHIADVVATDYFTSGTLARVLDPQEQDVAIFRVSYRCVSEEQLAAYRTLAAPALQAHHAARFGTDVVAVRSVTEDMWRAHNTSD